MVGSTGEIYIKGEQGSSAGVGTSSAAATPPCS